MTLPIFPALAGVEFPVERSWRWSTQRQKAISGRETFQPQWSVPIRDYKLSVSVVNAGAVQRGGVPSQDYQLFVAFWNSVMSSSSGVFRFHDADDDTVTNEAMGAGDGVTTAFQLTRALGGFAEPVTGPRDIALAPTSVVDDGNCTVGVTSTVDDGNCTVAPSAWVDDGFCATMQIFLGSYATGPTTPLAPWAFAGGSADASGGAVLISAAPGNGIALHWTGVYDWLCRFSADSMGFNEFMYLLHEIKTIEFSTIKP